MGGANFAVLEADGIPYEVLGRALHGPRDKAQNLIPFLGAGASLGPPPPETPANVAYPQKTDLDALSATLNAPPGSHTDRLVRVAALLGAYLDASEAQRVFGPDPDLQSLTDDKFPPSVARLARWFAAESKYTALEYVRESLGRALPLAQHQIAPAGLAQTLDRLVAATGVGNPPDPLSSISSYFLSQGNRTQLWRDLQGIFATKRTPRTIHKVIARAAHAHVRAPEQVSDFLVITTNYDTLVEQALEALHVPFVVLMTRLADRFVLMRLSPDVPNAARIQREIEPAFPKNFSLPKMPPVVVVYKMHGCLHQNLTEGDDGIVISDDDYVDYLKNLESGDGMIPTPVTTLMKRKSFLFLGYGLKDWNVRIMLENARKARKHPEQTVDYSVTRGVGKYELRFLEKNNIKVLKNDLSVFARRLARELPPLPCPRQ